MKEEPTHEENVSPPCEKTTFCGKVRDKNHALKPRVILGKQSAAM